MDFPKMLYKFPGTEAIHGGNFATLIINDQEAEEAAVADGWSLSTDEAKAAAAKPSDDDNAPATREELEAKAKELGVSFSANIGDKKLAERIEEALAKQE